MNRLVLINTSCVVSVLMFAPMNLVNATEFPVASEEQAIAIAREVCAGSAGANDEWHAGLDDTGTVWMADNGASFCRKETKRLWSVDIPVNGPMPTICSPTLSSLYICSLEAAE